MTRGKRSTPIEVRLLREGIVESVHQVQAVVGDARGRLLSSAGNPEFVSFIRSSLAPFQALAVTTTGTMERFNLSDRDLAIICSSHQGTMEQARQVFNILWRSDIDPLLLQCPIPAGQTSPLQHNCSGKHAGMLAVCQQCQFPLQTYLQKNHPVQKLILDKLADLLKMPGEELISAQDDCGAPTYLMQLGQMASLYARLVCGKNLDLERVIRAMISHPPMIAGVGSFDTEVMQLSDGQIVSKSGAGGVQCIGLVKEGMGLAIKAIDGSEIAAQAVAIHLLKQLGWVNPTIAENLAEKFMNQGTVGRLEVIGELALL